MDIVVIGAQKAGTTWLFSMLKQQPHVGFAHAKEVHYFDKLEMRNFDFNRYRQKFLKKRAQSVIEGKGRYGKYLDDILNADNPFTDDWYRSLFLNKPQNNKLIKAGVPLKFIDASPSYMTLSDDGVKHMAETLPDIEPILIVRDPVKRMISGISMELARYKNLYQFTDENIIDLINIKQIPRGNYSAAIPRFRQHFKKLHIIWFRDIAQNPKAVLREIEERYGLAPMEYSDLHAKNNSKSGKVTLSDRVLQHIHEVCADEYIYLKAEFGEACSDRL